MILNWVRIIGPIFRPMWLIESLNVFQKDSIMCTPSAAYNFRNVVQIFHRAVQLQDIIQLEYSVGVLNFTYLAA